MCFIIKKYHCNYKKSIAQVEALYYYGRIFWFTLK
jgi:hypothetical protein